MATHLNINHGESVKTSCLTSRKSYFLTRPAGKPQVIQNDIPLKKESSTGSFLLFESIWRREAVRRQNLPALGVSPNCKKTEVERISKNGCPKTILV